MAKLNMCVLHNATGQDGFLADQGNTDTGSKTSIRDIMNSVLELNCKMFEFVSGKKYVSRRFEAADNDGGGVFADSISIPS